jgi:hypothetical protein
MNWGTYVLCGWPGLPTLWHRGNLSSLAVAVGFSLLLNLSIVATFIWPRLLGEFFPAFIWPVLTLFWMGCFGFAYKTLPVWSQPAKIISPDQAQQSDVLFLRAQREYLGGDLDKAEKILRKCLDLWPRDIEARLLLATLLRHARRLYDASSELENLLKYDESANWLPEIRSEQRLIRMVAEEKEN